MKTRRIRCNNREKGEGTSARWRDGPAHAHSERPPKPPVRFIDGFWEFVSGPLNAGSFGPNALDAAFGLQVVFFKAPPPGQVNLLPCIGLQFFNEVNIDAHSHDMTVDLLDVSGLSAFTTTLQARLG